MFCKINVEHSWSKDPMVTITSDARYFMVQQALHIYYCRYKDRVHRRTTSAEWYGTIYFPGNLAVDLCMLRQDIIELLAAKELGPRIWFAILSLFMYACHIGMVYDPVLRLLGEDDEVRNIIDIALHCYVHCISMMDFFFREGLDVKWKVRKVFKQTILRREGKQRVSTVNATY